MAEYKFDEDSVKALIDWAKSTSFPQSVTLSEFTCHFNPPYLARLSI